MLHYLSYSSEPVVDYLLLISLTIFCCGFFGVLFAGHKIILFLMCIELMWLGVGLLFISSFIIYQEVFGVIFTVVILAVAASETAIGLALLVNFYRYFKTVELVEMDNLRS